ncbi:hypothetical protein CDAR_242081 [Caerostris darwini]|uniref:Uncharacterized protein n=1 Tax=Caerostris darwini TaxID=1538125 RepID=A0AAV4NQ35_9ARAC|nr:hypothetical protein CDAR_242081 [Caerostris darwini]
MRLLFPTEEVLLALYPCNESSPHSTLFGKKRRLPGINCCKELTAKGAGHREKHFTSGDAIAFSYGGSLVSSLPLERSFIALNFVLQEKKIAR